MDNVKLLANQVGDYVKSLICEEEEGGSASLDGMYPLDPSPKQGSKEKPFSFSVADKNTSVVKRLMLRNAFLEEDVNFVEGLNGFKNEDCVGVGATKDVSSSLLLLVTVSLLGLVWQKLILSCKF